MSLGLPGPDVDSFEDLGITPELVEALAAEGIEVPTPLQESAIPIIRKGNNLVLAAGPGSGLLVAWAVGLLDRLDGEAESPRALVACASPGSAHRLAESLARMGSSSGLTVSALGGAWALPERADVLVGSVQALVDALSAGRVSVEAVEAVVVDQAHLLEDFGGIAGIERIFDYAPGEAQRILSALPMSTGVKSLVDRLFKRTMTVPEPLSDVPKRGEVRFRITPEPREEGALRVVEELLASGARHALVYCHNADRAADVGDYMTLHGFVAGAPGDASVPVWLGIDALEARAEAKGTEGLVVVSCDAPTDVDMLDRRHSIGDEGVVVVLARELAHLKNLGKRTGYETIPFPPPVDRSTPVTQLRDSVEQAMQEFDTAPYVLALEPLFEKYDPAEVAAAAVAMLRSKQAVPDRAPEEVRHATGAASAAGVPSWAKLFLSVGERDGLRVGDLLGAVTGEANVPGEAVGKIDIQESHSLVEVHDTVARTVIQALNGTTIKGRSVRVDFDRPRRTIKRPRA